jgi:dihydrodipicolinate synthase/N-acetylneuraminate lyase
VFACETVSCSRRCARRVRVAHRDRQCQSEANRGWRAAGGSDADAQQAALDTVRTVFQQYPMIPALKAAIAHHRADPQWATVRPPLVELLPLQQSALVQALESAGFSMPGL